MPAVRPPPAHRRVWRRAPGATGPWAPRRRGASRPGSQPTTPTGFSQSQAKRPNPPPPPARVFKDILLFLPRTKDNKRGLGATYRIGARLLAPGGRPHSIPAPGLSPARERDAGAPESLCGRCRSGAFGVVGPAAPGAPVARSDPDTWPISSQPGPLRPREPAGRSGAAPRQPAGPAAASERLTARGAAASPAILCRVCVCGVSLASPLSALLPPPPPPRPTHHTTWPLRCGGGCGGGRRAAALLPDPLLHTLASRLQPQVPERTRAAARPPRPLALHSSYHAFLGAASRTLTGVSLPPNNNYFDTTG